jgi:hypothetical protein
VGSKQGDQAVQLRGGAPQPRTARPCAPFRRLQRPRNVRHGLGAPALGCSSNTPPFPEGRRNRRRKHRGTAPAAAWPKEAAASRVAGGRQEEHNLGELELEQAAEHAAR